MNISTRKSLILIILVFAFDLVTACADNDKNVIQETYTIQHEGVTITVAVESFLQSGVKQQKSSLPNLFDGNLESGWLPLGRPVVYWEPEIPGCTTEITFIFSEPVYIKEMVVANGYPAKDGSYRNAAKEIAISTYGDEQISEPIFGDHFKYTLEKTGKEQQIPFSNGLYSSILRTKALTLDILNCYQSSTQDKVGFREIGFKFMDKPAFNATMTINEIKRRFVKGKKRWYIDFPDPANPPIIIDTIRANLVYEALKGNKEAESLLNSYIPKGSFSGEEHSYFLRWFETTKAQNAKVVSR